MSNLSRYLNATLVAEILLVLTGVSYEKVSVMKTASLASADKIYLVEYTSQICVTKYTRSLLDTYARMG